MKSGSESNASKKLLNTSNIRITPVGGNTIGVMSDGSGLLELELERTTVDDSPITTTKTYEIVQEFELNEDILKIFYPSWSPDSSKYWVQVDTVTRGPAKPRWNAGLLVWWWYLKDYIRWRRQGCPESTRTIIVPQANILIGEER